MIDFDLSDLKLGYSGWYVEGRPGGCELRGIAHAKNCRCSHRAIGFYDAYQAGVEQKTLAAKHGISSSRVGQLVNRVRLCKSRAVKQTLGAFTAMSERDALYLIDCLKGIELAAKSA